VQLFQVLDLVLILLGKSKGSIVGAFFQILGRNLVSLLIANPDSDQLRFATVVIIWSMADVNRYLYYLFKDNLLTGMLRYNSFLLLYPLGGYGEIMLINDFL
jgi:very-long-chain (3R)-3-hydroxyacyl-CoA dehydratase